MTIKGKPGTQLWHGSPSGELRGSSYGLHLGTREAASQALNARIGKPVEGEWDGSRTYGETLLEGQHAHRYDATTKTFTREKVGEDHYPSGGAAYSDNTKIPLDARPSVFPVSISGPMSNTPQTPHADFKANGYMAGQIKRGTAKKGYFYTNEMEDEGSVSAVVPGAGHVRHIPADAVTAMLGGPRVEKYR